jgi:ATP-dependent Lhr-like helicase
LRKFRVDDAVFWINAMDPVSFCGLGLESTRGSLPSRIPSNHLVYCGTTLAVVSRRNGKSLDLRLPPDDSRLPRAFGLFKDLLGRQFRAMSRVEVEQVNGMPVLECDFVKAMLAFGFEKDASRLVLHRRY